MPFCQPPHRGIEDQRPNPGQQHREHHRPRKIGEANDTQKQQNNPSQVSDRAPAALPPRSGPPIQPGFSRRPAGDARLGSIMMMGFARVQECSAFLTDPLRKETGCPLAVGASDK